MKYHVLIFSTVLLLFSCKNNEMKTEELQQEEVVKEVEAEAQAPNYEVINKLLSPQAFNDKMNEIGEYNLLDIRTTKEIDENGGISGAFNLDFYGEDFKDKLGALDKEVPTFIYCRSGGRSGQAAAIMKEMGFKEVYDLEGGFMSWTANQ